MKRNPLLLTFILTVLLFSLAHTDNKQPLSEKFLNRVLKRFPDADLNGDGTLDVKEIRSYKKKNVKQSSKNKRLKPTWADIRYGTYSRNLLDLYQASDEEVTPVLVFFHGGGFVSGDKSKAGQVAIVKACLENGISVISANYRLARVGKDKTPATPYPGAVLDGARVIQFLRSRSSDLRIDPDRIAISGSSAGAVIAMWVGFHDDLADPQGDIITRQSSRVSGVLSYGGPTTLEPAIILKHIGGSPDIHPSLTDFFSVDSVADLKQPAKAALAKDASPLNHLTVDDPPVYASYNGEVATAPLPASAHHGQSIHHAMFGKLLKTRCDELGIPCFFTCKDVKSNQTDIGFLKKIFNHSSEVAN